MRSTTLTGISLVLLALLPALPASGAGARLFKSGPIQITADGRFVWVVNPDNDSVSRIDTASEAVTEFPLPGPGRHAPRGLSVKEDGSEVWVACHDSDEIVVLRGDASVLDRIALPWGSGPYSVALSRDQSRALVTLHRANRLAVVDVATRAVTHVLDPVFWAPLGVAWMEDGVSAWVTHLFADGEDAVLARVDFSGPVPAVSSKIIVKSTEPKHSSLLAAPYQTAEGGYLTFRGHAAQVPSPSGRNELWIPTQYNNINEDTFSPDSTIQTTLRHLNLATKVVPNTNVDKVILSAVYAHDPATSVYAGAGWDAHVSGPVDIAFSADGALAFVVDEQSDDLVVVPTATQNVRPPAAPPLVEIPLGARPMGIAASPVTDLAYVTNQLGDRGPGATGGRTVSVVDLAARVALRSLAITPLTGEPFAPTILRGARLFHTSDDPRISQNQKVACASCHAHGEHDGRSWDLQHLPGNHGPRSTMSLLGLGQTFGPPDPVTGFGQLHRSGDRDEGEDFEHTFQGPMMGGTGFLGTAVQPELGPPQPFDPDLSAIAAYMLSLEPVRRSPARDPNGALSEAAVRGATFFAGTDPLKPADAACARCHVPETGFVDFQFHDVGQRRPNCAANAENELCLPGRAPYQWQVNTPTLVGVWTTPPYDGVAGFTASLPGVIQDLAQRTSHGRPGGLTIRQRADLAEFVRSIDGDMTAAEVRTARDTTPPHIVRVEPASLTTVDVWFSETVEPTAAGLGNWLLRDATSTPVAITAARWDARTGDRVTLTTALTAGCLSAYTLEPVAGPQPIADAAARASGGVANLLDVADPRNRRTFPIGNTITVTLGASGYENITVAVHDSAMVGPGLATWGHDSIWLGENRASNWQPIGFVRFAWRQAFAAVSGIASSADIVDAGFSLEPEWGDAQEIEARRCLQSWSDTPTGNDWNSNPTGAPTWRDHAHPNGAWNVAGAKAIGGTGTVVSDYGSSFDRSAVVDTLARMPAINQRAWFSGPLVTDAHRFWFDNPAVDYGYALNTLPGAQEFPEAKFERVESDFGDHGPVLRITYRVASGAIVTPREVSGGGVTPLWLAKVAAAASDVRMSFQNLGAEVTGNNVYEGTIGSYYSHARAGCGLQTVAGGPGRRELVHAPAAGSRYFIVTGTNACAEGPSDVGHPPALLDCVP